MTLADDEVVGFQAGPTTEQSGELTRLGREQSADAAWLKTTVETIAATLNATLDSLGMLSVGGVSIPDPTIRTEVHYATLTAYVREQLEAGREIDLDVLGAQVGEIAEIKTQNEPKATRKRK
jgi:hypothetical protein